MQHGDDDPIDQIGAGDQGMMFGYACTETEELMPLPITLAHKIAKRLSEVRKAQILPYLRPDGKTQVTVRYEVDEHGRQRPVEVVRVLVSTQHRDGLDEEALIKPDLIEHVLHPILPRDLYDERRFEERDFVLVNPTGKFVVGGPMGDTGLTGRKIIVDTDGGAARHGGGAFSGSDPTKVDRLLPTPSVTWPRTSSPPAWRSAAVSRSPTRLASRTRSRSRSSASTRRRSWPASRSSSASTSTCGRAPSSATSTWASDLLQDGPYGHFGRAEHDFTWERTEKADALRAPAGSSRPRSRLLAAVGLPARSGA